MYLTTCTTTLIRLLRLIKQLSLDQIVRRDSDVHSGNLAELHDLALESDVAILHRQIPRPRPSNTYTAVIYSTSCFEHIFSACEESIETYKVLIFPLIALSYRSTHRCLCESVNKVLKYIKALSHRERCVERCGNAINGKIRT